MNKKAYPDKYLFNTTYHNMSNIYRAFMFECGGQSAVVNRNVPNILDTLSDAGGLFECLGYISFFINIILIAPLDSLEFFFAV